MGGLYRERGHRLSHQASPTRLSILELAESGVADDMTVLFRRELAGTVRMTGDARLP